MSDQTPLDAGVGCVASRRPGALWAMGDPFPETA